MLPAKRVTEVPRCRLCGGDAEAVGVKDSAFGGRRFEIRQCGSCHFGCVDQPRMDFDALYDDAYYRGQGADPLVDYAAEMEDPSTFRRYEWRGISRIVHALYPVTHDVQWLDLGSGLGGLVRYLRASGLEHTVGSEDGYARGRAVDAGIPCLSSAELAETASVFDVITSIEVLEHVIDPMSFLGEVERLLKPGGVFFFTTGNARRYRGRLCDWAYVIPDVHVSFYEPSTIERALGEAGLVAEYHGFLAGHDDVIKYKTLKNLPRSLARIVERAPGWSVATRAIDRRFGVSAFPVGRKPKDR